MCVAQYHHFCFHLELISIKIVYSIYARFISGACGWFDKPGLFYQQMRVTRDVTSYQTRQLIFFCLLRFSGKELVILLYLKEALCKWDPAISYITCKLYCFFFFASSKIRENRIDFFSVFAWSMRIMRKHINVDMNE